MKEFRKNYRESKISDRKLVIAFDSTNINTNSKGIETAEFGHPKKNEKLPVASTAMGVDESTGIPVYYEDFIGSLLDKTQLEATRKKIKEIGFRKVFCQMKSFTNSEKCYCHGTQTYIGRDFVLFFALVMRLAFRFLERDCFQKEGYVSSDTTATVLGYASKLIAYKTKGNGWQRKYALTSKMKSVFRNLGYDEAKIDGFLRTEVKSV